MVNRLRIFMHWDLGSLDLQNWIKYAWKYTKYLRVFIITSEYLLWYLIDRTNSIYLMCKTHKNLQFNYQILFYNSIISSAMYYVWSYIYMNVWANKISIFSIVPIGNIKFISLYRIFARKIIFGLSL